MLTINAHSDTNTLIIRVGQIQNILSIYILCNYPYLFEIYNHKVQFLDSRNYSSNLTGLRIMFTINKEVICQTDYQMIEMTRNFKPKMFICVKSHQRLIIALV